MPRQVQQVQHHVQHQVERHVQPHVAGVKQRYQDSSADHLWRRLDAMDFINRGMLFAAILLLCFFPFVIVVNALAGRSAVTSLTRHLGLNQHAARIVSELFTSSSATANSLSGASYVLFILGGIAAASAIQDLYERAFGLETRGMRDVLRRLVWLGVVMAASFLAGWAGPHLHHNGGPVLLIVAALILLIAFWWFTQWFLLAGRVHWRALLPSAVATSLFWVGMEIVFWLTFSNTVISNDKKYGPIGVVFALMSWLIAIGVVIILGAVAGIVWRERGLTFSAGFRRIFRRSRPEGGGPTGESGVEETSPT
jgi:membrane protein